MNSETTTRNSILVVEDSTNERVGMCRLLERSGFRVTAAADGVEALEQIQRERFDLLLVDAGLPRMSGLELISRLPEDSRPKTLLITGDARAETVLGALREHAERCIAKPVEPAELVKTIRSELGDPPVANKIQVLSADPHLVELRFPCERRVADRIQEYLRQLESGLQPKVRQSVELAFHELLMNAIEWGGRLDPACEVQITFVRTPRLLLFRIADPGTGFDPAKMWHAAIGHPGEDANAHVPFREAEGIRPGGFGIVLAKAMADELVYNEAHNEVILLKYLDASVAA